MPLNTNLLSGRTHLRAARCAAPYLGAVERHRRLEREVPLEVGVEREQRVDEGVRDRGDDRLERVETCRFLCGKANPVLTPRARRETLGETKGKV